MHADDLTAVPGSLISRFPASALERDDVFIGLLDWMTESGRTAYAAQEEAFMGIFSDSHIVLETPTGSGKSMVGVACHLHHITLGQRSCYTSPVKALVNEKYRELVSLFGEKSVGLATGDHSINTNAMILCCTAEIFASIAAAEGDFAGFKGAVLDEFHFYGDRQRGMAWQLPLLLLEKTQFILMSATLGDSKKLQKALEERTKRPVQHVQSTNRPVPLEYRYLSSHLQESIGELIGQQAAPIYVVNFTHQDVMKTANGLLSIKVVSSETRQKLKDSIKRASWNTPFGKELKRLLQGGIGVHFAGMLPKYRTLVEKLAQAGLLGVICGTDTLGVGINMPIRTVLFSQLCKYDGRKTRILSAREFHQIAGRAGRKGFDNIGLVCAQAPQHVIENEREKRKMAAKGRSSKKVRLQKAPDRNYAHWTQETFETLQTLPPEPLKPHFELEHRTVLDLMRRGDLTHRSGGAYRRLVELIENADTTTSRKRGQRRRLKRQTRELVDAGLIYLDREKRTFRANERLQENFSIFSEMSLFIVWALKELHNVEFDPLSVIGLIESVQEDSGVILRAQLNKLRQEALSAMKADGVPYEERIERLDALEPPAPENVDQIIQLFEQYAQERPYLSNRALSPKWITGHLINFELSFNEYIRELGLKNVEGLMLRYLSQSTKMLTQTIPEELSTRELKDAIGHLRSIIGAVDRTYEAAETPTATNVISLKTSEEKTLSEREARGALLLFLKSWQRESLETMNDLCVFRSGEDNSSSLLEKMVADYRAEYGRFMVNDFIRDKEALSLTRNGRGFDVTYRLHPSEESDPPCWLIGSVQIDESPGQPTLLTVDAITDHP